MKHLMKLSYCLLLINFVFSNNQYPNQSQVDEILNRAMEQVWREAMIAKQAISASTPVLREELLDNLCSSAPSDYFTTHADLSDSLTSGGNTSASIFVSTDNQSTWIVNSEVYPLNSPGYENTWGAVTNVPNVGSDISWFLSGSVDSESIGLDFGQVTVSQSPYNADNTWPPSDNLYATIATDDTGETGSGQDIVDLKATYSDDKLFTSMVLNGSCCNEGSFFGPWNLYAIAVVNPDAVENGVAYAYAYGDGGFGQLYPGIYKITGDFSSGVGEVGGFEVLSENFNYTTNGNQLQASSLLSIITNDSDWGEWPNSFNGVGLVGVTLEASLDGLDVGIDLLDTSDVGVFIMSTQSQQGNIPPVLSEPTYEDGVLSITYTDFENNLATTSDVFIDDMGIIMTPDSHTYSEGVIFSAEIGTGYDTATLSFSDGAESVQLTVELEGGGNGSCTLAGDVNGDTSVNVIDIVLTTNLILCQDCPDNYDICADLNGDGAINVLDIVSIVNLILNNNQ